MTSLGTAPCATPAATTASGGADFLGTLVAAAVTLTAINLLLPNSGGTSTPDETRAMRIKNFIDIDRAAANYTGMFKPLC